MTGASDVVVVGGGIIGCASAYELARRGLRVTLVERGELAAGASGRNHGLLLAPLDPVLAPMAGETVSCYEEALDSVPLPVHVDPAPIGFLIVPVTPEEREAAEEEARAAERAGILVEHVTGRSVRELEPAVAPDLEEGWLLHDARRLDPQALTVGLGLLAGRRGAELLLHTAARALLVTEDGVRGVVTDRGPITAEIVVLAAGPWSPTLLRPLGLHAPVIGARGWLVQVGPVPGLLHRVVGRAGWHTLPHSDPLPPALAEDLAAGRRTGVVGSLLQPNRDGTLLLGGSRQAAVGKEPEDPGIPAEIVRQGLRLVPGLADAHVLSAWWGLRPATPDGRPIVGTVADGLVLATGHGSQGVILGGGTARLVAAIATREEPPFDPHPFRPPRFSGLARNIGA